MGYHRQIQPFHTLPLKHYFMFGQIMQSPDICTMFLEELFGWEIEKIDYIEYEKNLIDSPDAHGIRLDIYIRQSDTVYNVEMQSKRDFALEHRIRYYQSGIDREELKKGASYDELPETFIIFLCDYDPVGTGSAIYRRVSHWENEAISYEDGTHVLLLNSHYTKGNASPAILELLDYVRTSDDDADYSSPLMTRTREQVHKVRMDETARREYMTFEMKLQEVIRETKREVTKEVTEEVTREVTREVTEKVTKAVTEEVTRAVTKRVRVLSQLELICKKLQKGKSAEAIADELEADLAQIEHICRIAAELAPDYDPNKLYEALK